MAKTNWSRTGKTSPTPSTSTNRPPSLDGLVSWLYPFKGARYPEAFWRWESGKSWLTEALR